MPATPKIDISREAAAAMLAARKNAPRFTGYVCCARVYVQLVGRVSAKSTTMLRTMGLNITPRAHHCPAIYVGYDNASGHEYGQAQAMASVLQSFGVGCYEDADMD